MRTRQPGTLRGDVAQPRLPDRGPCASGAKGGVLETRPSRQRRRGSLSLADIHRTGRAPLQNRDRTGALSRPSKRGNSIKHPATEITAINYSLFHLLISETVVHWQLEVIAQNFLVPSAKFHPQPLPLRSWFCSIWKSRDCFRNRAR